MYLCVYGAASNSIDPAYLSAGEKLGEAMAARGHHLIFGGGASGMMGAVARGITRGNASKQNGEPSEILGIVPEFFHRDGVLYSGCTRLEFTETMRQRKQRMEELADAFLISPGGVGTWDEFFEILTLRQLNRHQKPILIWNLRGYFRPMLDMMEHAIAEGFLLPGCRTLFRVCETETELMDALEIPMDAADPAALRQVQAK